MTIMSRKIPGLLPPMPTTERVEKLELKTKTELLELLERQEKMLSNRNFISRLPDKGAKIKLFQEKLKDELAHENEVEKSCNLFSNLNLNSTVSMLDKTAVENIEWEGQGNRQDRLECLDSDDDSDPEDPLAIIAQSTDLKKKIIILKKEESLIKPEDLKEISTFTSLDNKTTNGSKTDNMDEHIKYVFENTINKVKPNQRVSFKPYKTTVSNVHDPSKEILRKRGKFWEVTAATPPPAIHGPIQEIPLQESLRLQDVQNQHLKEVQTKHAAERLAAQLGKSMGDLPLSSISKGKYRDVAEMDSEDSDNSSDNETSDKEVHDEEPNEGGVVFTIMN